MSLSLIARSSALLPRSILRLASKTTTTTTTLPRGTASRCSMSTAEKFRDKEHVEEERFARALEEKYLQRKRAELQQKQAILEAEHYQQVVVPMMMHVQKLLNETGDHVSEDALEELARWKLFEE